MKKINWKKVGIIFLWMISISGVVVSMAFIGKEQKDVLCEKIKIELNKEDENFFINKEDILSILVQGGDSLVGKRADDIDVRKLESLITSNKFVQSADVFIDINGNLKAVVKQRKPVLRLITRNTRSFYLDDRGLKMPLSDNYSARVLVANGNIEEIYGGQYDSVRTQLVKDLYALVMFIRADEFWDAQIEQVYIENNGDIVLIPRVGNHKIVLGDISNMEEKFSNLLILYKRALSKMGWDAYTVINLKYEGQIVCTRNGAAEFVPVAKSDSLNTDTTVKIN